MTCKKQRLHKYDQLHAKEKFRWSEEKQIAIDITNKTAILQSSSLFKSTKVWRRGCMNKSDRNKSNLAEQ